MLTESLRQLYSHVSQDPLLLEDEEVVRVESTSLCESDFSRRVVVHIPEDATATEIVQRNFYSPLSAASRVPCWSQVSIYARIPLVSSIIRSSANGMFSQHRRIEYQDLEDNPVPFVEGSEEEVTEEYRRVTSGNVTDIYIFRPKEFEEELSPGWTRKHIYKVSDTQSTISLLQHINNEEGYIDWEQVSRPVSLSTAVLSGSKDGWLPAARLGQSMESTTPTSITWGLLAAIASEDVYVTVMLLRQLVTLVVRYGWIAVPSGVMSLVSQPASYFGFEHTVSVFDRVKHSRFKEVSSNALLGIAICKALEYLQDSGYHGEYLLGGVFYDLEELLRHVLKGQALFCAGAIAPDSQRVAYKEEFGYYSYEAPSYTASFYTDIFLNSYLNYDDDVDIQLLALQLHYSLANSPIDIDNPYFYNYVGGLFDNAVFNDYPQWVTQIGTPPEHLQMYTRKLNLIAKMGWSLHYGDRLSFVSSAQRLEEINAALSLLSYGLGDPADYLATSIYLSLQQGDRTAWGLVGDVLMDIGLTYEAYDLYLVPAWGLPLLDNAPNLLDATRSTSTVYLHVLLSQVFDWLPKSVLKLYESETLSGTARDLYQLRGMMPVGDFWFSQDKVDNISSNIGSMLHSEAHMYADWHLNLLRLLSSVSPHTAVGRDEQRWFSALVEMPEYLSGLERRREMVGMLMQARAGISPDFIPVLSSSLFRRSCTVSSLPLPLFNTYHDMYVTDESREAFSPELVTATGMLTQETYMGAVYRREDGKWVPRKVAGLPRIDLPEGYEAVTPAQYLDEGLYQDFERKLAVEDGEIYVLPLSRYLSLLEVTIQGSLPHSFSRVIKNILPAGIYLNIKCKHD